MEPFSVIGATAGTIKLISSVSVQLYEFVNASKNVDQTVKDLATEVNALHRTLLEVQSVLQQRYVTEANKRISTDDGSQLWELVRGCLDDCQVTVVRLDSALDSVNKKSSNWMKQMVKQVRLNLKADDINSLRVQIHTHYIALGTALQVVNIRAAYLAPMVVIDDLAPRIDALQQALELLTTSLEDQNIDASRVPQNSVQMRVLNAQKLHSMGKWILDKATTIYGSSRGEGSVYGQHISRETFNRTMNWIPDTTSHDRTLSMSSTALSSRDQTGSSVVDDSVNTSVTQSHTVPSGFDIIESDTEAEFELDFTQRLLAKGQKAFESADYRAAAGFLQKGVAASYRLPHKLRSQLNLVDIPLMIATCKYHMNEIDEASRELIALMQQESSSDQDAIRKCQISHLLSQICVIKNDIEAAEEHCRNSLKGRRRLLGNGHEDYFASLALLSEIGIMSGKSEEAAVLKDMLPPNFQQSTEMKSLQKLRSGRDSLQTSHRSSTTLQIIPSEEDATGASFSSAKEERVHCLPFDTQAHELRGHTKTVRGVAFSPDSLHLASTSYDETVRVWDIKTGQQRQVLEGHTDYVRGVTFSPDGLLVASASMDKTVRVWDVKTGYQRQVLKGHTDYVLGVAFSPDGLLVASASNDETVRVWNVKTGHQRPVLKGYTDYVFGVAFSPDSFLVASASRDKTVRVWDVKTGQQRQVLKGHSASVRNLAFSSDGLLVASASLDKTIRVWDVKTGQRRQELVVPTRDAILGMGFSPDGLILASSSADGIVRLWRARRTRVQGSSEPSTRNNRE